MLARSRRALLLLPLLALGGCNQRTQPPVAGDAAAAKASGIRGRSAPLAPLALGPLAAADLRAVVALLLQAHYDPETLGLEELGFEAELALPKRETRAQGVGTWRKGSGPEVRLRAVSRKGKTETTPSEPGVKTQIWDSLRLQLQNLLEGLGRGFLTERLRAWSKLEGRAALKEGKLVLSFDEEGGANEVTIGEGYRVERVVNRSPKRVTRSMEYQHALDGGRNRVVRALFRVEIEQGTDLPPRAVKIMDSQDGLTFELDYASVGGFWLPVKLRKRAPKGGDELEVTLRYTALRAR